MSVTLHRAAAHREPIAVALAVFFSFAVYVWSGWYWIDLVDEGYFLYLASRVHDGDLPYRDFDTYYTPGVFYLYATAFKLFGVGVIPVRVLMAGVRVACALLLYRLARRVMPWPFAILTPLMVAGVDLAPVFPEPHPAWMGLLATLLTVEMIARHQASGRLRWVALAGATAGLAFLFKQNVGAFAALAVGGYLLLRRREDVGWLTLTIQAMFVAGLGLAVSVFLWPALTPTVAATLWLPLLVTLALLIRVAWAGVRPESWRAGLRAVLTESVLASATFTGVTLLWLGPLTIALGPRATPFGLFVGSVNQMALILPLGPLPDATTRLALLAIWLPLGVAALLRRGIQGRGWHVVSVAVCLSLLVPWLPTAAPEPLTVHPDPDPWLESLAQLGTLYPHAPAPLYPYLPSLCAWAGLAMLALQVRHREPLGPMPWYLLAGVLAALALYPRSDVPHAMFAGPPLFVVGVWAMARAHRALIGCARPGQQLSVFVALLVVPAAAVAPYTFWLYTTVVAPDPWSPEPPLYVPLGLERAPVLAPRRTSESVRSVVEFVRAGVSPGEPLFAYPSDPMFNFLADRPNPTRFDHFFPGALTPEEMQQVITSLDAARPRYIIWDYLLVVAWRTEPANRPLSEYIWRCYRQVTDFPPFLILERREC